MGLGKVAGENNLRRANTAPDHILSARFER